MKIHGISQNILKFSLAEYECHCCGSFDTAYVQHYVLRRTFSTVPLYYCRFCGSISVDFMAVKNQYPVSNAKEALEFHKKISTRNQVWAEQLFDKIEAIEGATTTPTAVIDIGCGTGILLNVADRRGMRAIGYEVDKIAIEEARKNKQLEITKELFSGNSVGISNAIVCCIMVLEHLRDPLTLLNDIAEYCKRNNASAFVSLPLLPENWSEYLDKSVHAKGNPFFDNEEHVTHFSRQCFHDSWLRYFTDQPLWISAGGWSGYFHRRKST